MIKCDTRHDATEFSLSGLDGGNSLAFLAAVGTLRTATQIWPDDEPKMRWIMQANCWRPMLSFAARDGDRQEFLDTMANFLCEGINNRGFKIGDNLNITAKEFRTHATAAVAQAHKNASGRDREFAEFLAAFACDQVQVKQGNKIVMDDTSFRTMSGAGHQHFLKFMRELIENTDASHLESSLFEVWRYTDNGRGMNLRWDPEDDRRYALRWQNPSSDPSVTMRGANRLAIEALPLLPCMPTQRRVETAGFTIRRGEGALFTWPIWNCPISANACRSLLALPDIQVKRPNTGRLKLMSIEQVYRSKRFTNGKFRNFTPAEPL